MNLGRASIILGAATENGDLIERIFFSQIVPKLPATTKRKLIVIPKRDHKSGPRLNEPCGVAHLNLQLSKSLYARNLIPKEIVSTNKKMAEDTYTNGNRRWGELYSTPNFSPSDNLQPIFGMKEENLYQYTDKLHPARNLRQGFEWDK